MDGGLLKRIQKAFPQVTEVVDADEPIIVHVLKSDAAQGTKLVPKECALAKACKRIFEIDGAIINLGSSFLITGSTAIRYRTSQGVAREIVSFDRHSDFRPGDYKLNVPPISQKLGPKPRKERGETGKRPRGKPFIHRTVGVRGRRLNP